MSSQTDLTPPTVDADVLQFDVAEPTKAETPSTAAPTATCAGCKRPIESTYYAVGSNVICATCAASVNALPAGRRSKRLGLATLYGIGAAIAGAIIWYAIRRITHMEIGYVAILVGFMVGGAVRKGSGNRGGRGYQILALVLTYCSIAANYAPDVISALLEDYHKDHPAVAMKQPADAGVKQPTDAGVSMAAPATKNADVAGARVADATGANDATPAKRPPSLGRTVLAIALLTLLVAAVSLAAPFLAGFENIIGLLIIAFALFQAWKINRARRVPVTGPYQIGQPRAGGVV